MLFHYVLNLIWELYFFHINATFDEKWKNLIHVFSFSFNTIEHMLRKSEYYVSVF
jgi:hypothetical protein